MTSTAQTLLHTARDRGRHRTHRIEMLEEALEGLEARRAEAADEVRLLLLLYYFQA